MSDYKAMESHGNTLGNELKQFFIPSGLGIILYFLSGAVLLAALNARALWKYFAGISVGSSASANTLLSQKVHDLGAFVDSVLSGRVSQIVFWSLVGCVVYIAIWLVKNVIVGLENDVIASRFVHPRQYNKITYWGSVLAHKIFFVCGVALFIVYTSLGIEFILPLMTRVFYLAVTNFTPRISLSNIAAMILCGGLVIYVWVLMTHILINSWRWIISNS